VRNRLTCLWLVLLIVQVQAQDNALARFQKYRKAAAEAQRKGEYGLALENFNKLLEMVPDKPDINYLLAVTYAKKGDARKAMDYLRKTLDLGYPLDELDSSFHSVRGAPGFQELLAMFEARKRPVQNSRPAFTIPERDLLPEGIAYDPREDCFYLGSLWKSKIVKVGKDGKATDFIKEKQDGLRSVGGLKVDPERRVLWAVSLASAPWSKSSPGEAGWSAVFEFDLRTGKLVKEFEFEDKTEAHLFNDLVVTRAGDVFVTDSVRSEVFAIFHDRDRLESFFRSEDFMYTNGISLGRDDRTLYVASPGNGVFRIDVATKESRLVSHPATMTLSGIDGLYFYDNSLIGIQPSLNRVARFYLNPGGDSVERMEVLDARHPLFDFPTTGAIAGTGFYYIANSQAYRFQPDGTIFPLDKLKEVMILRAELSYLKR
jgi:sugar lactone lactonase YvrE